MKIYACDFETTVYDGQDHTEVWASGIVGLEEKDEPLIHHSITETLDYLNCQNEDAVLYYHNLKFDGNFWLYYLIHDRGFKQGYEYTSPTDVTWKKKKDLANNEVIYSISSMGQWYTITFKYRSHIYELRDSLKLLPFKLKEIGKGFKTKHQKLEMDYEGYRYAGCTITDEEEEYLKNDLYVLKEALNIMFEEGHNKLTIGACCLSEYKKFLGREDWQCFFPKLQDIEIDAEKYGSATADEYIRNSYHGGWCYRVDDLDPKKPIVCYKGTTADVNSLYPSMMHSQSGNYYPIGRPMFWSGNEIPAKALHENRYYFVRIRCRFYLKKDKLPFIQIKHNPLYKATQMLKTSDIYDKRTGKYYRTWVDRDGVEHDTKVILTLTMTDYKLIKEHYKLEDFEILDGCWFYAEKGIFDSYIDPYAKIKMESKGAKRTIAKLFLNNLYGKLATSKISSFKYAYEKDDGSIGYRVVMEENKEPVYIACGSAITSYSRNFTIRAAQMNYHGKGKRGFKYADTDSIHCDLTPDKIVGIKVHDTAFCCWKLESCWDVGKFIRQKTYVEHVTHEDLKKIDEPYYNIKCAGMPDSCKQLFLMSMGEKVKKEDQPKHLEKYKQFLEVNRTLDDFKIGLTIPSKLVPHNIKGGVILVETDYTLRDL